jgi:Flp pilus assembly protein TadG
MTVELAVTIPVLLAVLGVVINLMVFLGDCARFDRLAAEAVRIEAASPGYGTYGTAARAQAVQAVLTESFAEQKYLSVAVRAGGSGGGATSSTAGATFSLLPHQETFTCTLNYRPWGFGDSFFGVQFSGIEHTRNYVIDPFRPGVLL